MNGDTLILFVLLPLAAYVLGATPFAVLIARAHGKDLRRSGSGNLGATNVGRVVGRPWGYMCFVLDLGKGLAPALLAGWLLRGLPDFPAPAHQAAWLLAGLGAIAGHVFPFWLGFRGGKGVSTSLGVVLGIFPYFTYAGIAALVLWVVVTLASRYVSVGSMVSAVSFPLLVLLACLLMDWSLGRLWPLLAFAGTMAPMIVVLHRSNIRRLLAGTEKCIGASRAAADSPPR